MTLSGSAVGTEFYQLDVFTDRPFAGNPLAVFPHASEIAEAHLQSIAREMNLSETTFVYPSEAATRRVRIFTPTAEVPLAGHPTIGTWWLLAELGEVEVPNEGSLEVLQESKAGILPVVIESTAGRPARVTMTQKQPVWGERFTDPVLLAEALGTEPSAISTESIPTVVSTTFPQAMIRLESREALRALPQGGGQTLIQLLRSKSTDCAMCFVLEGDVAHCRFFAPGLGVPEDPATGSAAGALGAYLVEQGLIEPEHGVASLEVRQGVEIDRPSTIQVSVSVDDESGMTVRVGGSAVSVLHGAFV